MENIFVPCDQKFPQFTFLQCQFVFDKATKFHVKRRHIQVVAEIVSVVV